MRIEDSRGCEWIEKQLNSLSTGELGVNGENQDGLGKIQILTDHRPISSILLGKLLTGRGIIYCQKVKTDV